MRTPSFSDTASNVIRAIHIADIATIFVRHRILAMAAVSIAFALPVQAQSQIGNPLPNTAATTPNFSGVIIENTEWSLTEWRQANGSTRNLPPDDLPTLSFLPAGALSIYTGCNTFSSLYSLTNRRLTINPGRGTRKACLAFNDRRFEQDFTRSLYNTKEISRTSNSPLKLQVMASTGDTLIFSFTRRLGSAANNPRGLVTESQILGTAWILEKWTEKAGDARNLPVNRRNLPTLSFTGTQGQFSSFTGCATISGPYTVGNGTLDFMRETGDWHRCSGKLLRLDARYSDALTQIAQATITGQRMQFVLNNGEKLDFVRN